MADESTSPEAGGGAMSCGGTGTYRVPFAVASTFDDDITLKDEVEAAAFFDLGLVCARLVGRLVLVSLAMLE